MLRVGLTGGIGAGKSEVARRLGALGAVVVDADVLAREVVEAGTPGLERVVAAFGPDVLDGEGKLDRARLAARVFADQAELARLNAIVHPLVAARSAELTATAAEDSVVVFDVPLLVENGLEAGYDVVIVVDADDDLRLERLERRGMARADALARMAAQAGRIERLEAADFVVDNGGDPADLDAEVRRVWADLVVAARAR